MEDVVVSARLVLRYIERLTFEEFEANSEKQDAVVHRIESIGEATTNLARLFPSVVAAIPEVPWRKISGMRNFLVHEYWAIDLKLVWAVAHAEMQPLIAAIEEYRRRNP